jgi:L-ascorbate metabolism protein UlaG (beta-lactamase superfamily)
MSLTLVRHATLNIGLGGHTIIVDPMLSAQGELPHVGLTQGVTKNPLVEIGAGLLPDELSGATVLVTHLHFDHFDEAASKAICSCRQIVCSPAVAVALKKRGHRNVCPVDSTSEFDGVRVTRFTTRHATGPLGMILGKNSTFVLESSSQRVCISGDVVLDDLLPIVRAARPNTVVVNGGAATFRLGGRATLCATEIQKLAETVPDVKIIVVHLEAVNHCLEGRELTRQLIRARSVFIPEDGETVSL